ncbi:organic solute transporter Ostalpha-domain-containing protein [Radiomyces spectabilis]|uniref:organic solute transporter Ostalpha-domain-containing protein n=1 Tax=Radiomyces spectabilis TaxID=64574 RepID=UPI00221ECA0D|nr:organic solute transporter Ostalpha-domain-containing protein [Radiomyces spectabilis]KAI8384370.1 organic solute transporter Ostalpha-domain-containing protein [Radiomyces spectabilis]
MATSQCPDRGGLQHDGAFQPGHDISDLIHHPTYSWHLIGWLVSLVCVAVVWIVTVVIIIRHVRHYWNPDTQRHKLRVLLYPPVYSTLAWFAYLRYDYSTTIMFFATVFEAFAVFNLYKCLQAYLQPFRDEAGDVKEPITTKVMYIYKLHVKSKWGMHYRIINDILVYQFPIWSVLDAFMSIFAELKGRYCEGSYSFKGAYVYLTIINFCSLSLILTALFAYLAVYHDEWRRGKISAHGMFWCVKGPIMFIFYFGEILLTILSTANVIQGTDGSHSADGIAWPAAAVKNGLYVIVVCGTMLVDVFLMARYFGPREDIKQHDSKLEGTKLSPWRALYDAYIAYIPEFFFGLLCCGYDSYKLAKKRVELRRRKKQEKQQTNVSMRQIS